MVTECKEDERKKTCRIKGRKKITPMESKKEKKRSQTAWSELNNEQKAGVR